MVGALELGDLWGPFQPKPFCDSLCLPLPWVSISMSFLFTEDSSPCITQFLYGVPCVRCSPGPQLLSEQLAALQPQGHIPHPAARTLCQKLQNADWLMGSSLEPDSALGHA